jgi:hypothetical protein
MAAQPSLHDYYDGPGDEQRIARNGWPYTRSDFIDFYGEDWNARWEEASIATARRGWPWEQPAAAAGPGGLCTPAQLSPQAQPAPTIAGAPQPGAAAGPGVPSTPAQQLPQAQAGPTNAGAPPLLHTFRWCQALFFTEVLPANMQELANLVPHQTVYHTLREAIDAASGALYPHLPLLTAAFTNFDVAEALGEQGAIVVAEEVVRVPSPNRPPWNRVDFFCYKENGDVVRHHPGRSRAHDMRPHCMPLGNLCFLMADAARQGVGRSLHAQPPRMVQWTNPPLAAHHPPGAAQPGDGQPGVAQPGNPPGHLLATREDLDQLCVYDLQSVNWKAVREALRVLPPHDHTVDWSDGSHFPWWVWLANTGVLRDVVNDGVAGVELEVVDGNKCVIVHSVGGSFRLSQGPQNGKMVIRPTPPSYDP